MPGASRVSDTNSAGGSITSGASQVNINGRPAARVNDPISAHAPWGKPHPPHRSTVITSGSNSVIVEGQPIAKSGSSTSCGHSIESSSGDVIVP